MKYSTEGLMLHGKRHKRMYIGVGICIICLWILPIRLIVANIILHYQFFKMQTDAYQIKEITYTNVSDFQYSGYTMKLVGKKEDDVFHITWNRDGIYNSYTDNIALKRTTIQRFTQQFQDEVNAIASTYLHEDERIHLDFGGENGTAWMRKHLKRNESYKKDKLKQCPQQMGIHLMNRSWEEALTCIQQLQTTIQQKGYSLPVYNISITQGENQYTFSNLTNIEINEQLMERFQRLIQGESDTQIQYNNYINEI